MGSSISDFAFNSDHKCRTHLWWMRSASRRRSPCPVSNVLQVDSSYLFHFCGFEEMEQPPVISSAQCLLGFPHQTLKKQDKSSPTTFPEIHFYAPHSSLLLAVLTVSFYCCHVLCLGTISTRSSACVWGSLLHAKPSSYARASQSAWWPH